MKIAYFIMAHAKPRQFEWLMRAIADPRDLFFVHIDANTSETDRRKFFQIAEHVPNVRFIKSLACGHRVWALTETKLAGIRAALAEDAEWDVFVNLSGQCYPIKPLDAFRDYLSAAPGRNYVVTTPIREASSHVQRWQRFLYLSIAGNVYPTPLPLRRPKFDIYFGSQWHVVSRAFCEWMFAKEEPLSTIGKRLKLGRNSDEFITPTLIMNSPFAPTNVGDNLHAIDFAGVNPHPRVYTMDDLPSLLGSHYFFARKFDEKIDENLLPTLAGHIGAPVPEFATEMAEIQEPAAAFRATS